MKICQLLHAMTTGGAEVLADRMGRHFAQRHEVVYACLDGIGELGEILRADGFKVQELGRGEGIDVACIRRLARFLSDESVDVIHAHQYTPFFYGVAARTFSRRQPVVFTEHGRFHPDYPSRKRGLFNRAMLRRRDRVIAVGEQVKKALVDNEYIPSGRIEVIYNGIDLDPFLSGENGASKGIVATLGLPESAFVIVQVARLDPIKDHVLAVRAIAEATKINPDLHLLIVGEGPQRDVIEAEIETQSVSRHVHLLGLRDDVPAILKHADLLLLTSVSEGIPLTLIEGMASGTPCVSTDVGGIGEVISNETTGLLVPSGDVDALSRAILHVADNDGLRKELSERGRREAVERFSEAKMLSRYDDLFDDVVN